MDRAAAYGRLRDTGADTCTSARRAGRNLPGKGIAHVDPRSASPAGSPIQERGTAGGYAARLKDDKRAAVTLPRRHIGAR